MLSDAERRDEFMMAVVAFAQLDTKGTVAFFSDRESEYVEAYFSDFSITKQARGI